MTRDLATYPSGHDEGFEGDGTGFGTESLIEEFEDWNAGCGTDNGVDVVEAEEHGHRIEP
jgi:hypothetical protein